MQSFSHDLDMWPECVLKAEGGIMNPAGEGTESFIRMLWMCADGMTSHKKSKVLPAPEKEKKS